MSSRRDALKTIGAIAATATASGQHAHTAAETPVAVDKNAAPKVFRPEEIVLIGVLVDLIIPRTDTPGALDAGVPMLLDGVASRSRQTAETWRAALEWIRPQFAGQSHERQIELLTAWSSEKDTHGAEVFRLLKETTIDLYYSTKEGLVTELGWHGNTYLPDFTGCTHPDHQI